AFGYEDAAQEAAERGRDLGVDLVRRDLEQRLVRLDEIALRLEPARDGSLCDRFAELRHRDSFHHDLWRSHACVGFEVTPCLCRAGGIGDDQRRNRPAAEGDAWPRASRFADGRVAQLVAGRVARAPMARTTVAAATARPASNASAGVHNAPSAIAATASCT